LVPTDLVLTQPEVRLQLAVDLFHLPDIMPPKVEAFTRYISRPRHRYATCSLWRCPRCLSYASPLPASRAGALAYPCRITSRYHIPLTIPTTSLECVDKICPCRIVVLRSQATGESGF